ncbi:4930452B06Rik [Phodopus roborovskii]|uniref:4930452B06Rik protein n=1 Tax=Phodopus roborovskii TaxID=109678 RepID=A0AAV0A8U4_PHORO|nr:4930452B06Rik [Phodopus roborovskii]
MRNEMGMNMTEKVSSKWISSLWGICQGVVFIWWIYHYLFGHTDFYDSNQRFLKISIDEITSHIIILSGPIPSYLLCSSIHHEVYSSRPLMIQTHLVAVSSFINRGGSSIRNSKSQDVCHIAFGSRVLGPPPLSGRRNNLRLSSETVRSVGSKNSQLCQQPSLEKHVNTTQVSALLIPESEQQGEKGNIYQVKQTRPTSVLSFLAFVLWYGNLPTCLPVLYPHPPQQPSAGQSSNGRACLKSTGGEKTEAPCGSASGNNRNEEELATTLNSITQPWTEPVNSSTPEPQAPDQPDEWIFPESAALTSGPACGSQSVLLDGDSCISSHLWLETSEDSEPDQAEETQKAPKDIFTFSSRPRSAPHGKSHDMSPKGYPFILNPEEDNGMTRSDTQLEDDFYGTDSSQEIMNHKLVLGPSLQEVSVWNYLEYKFIVMLTPAWLTVNQSLLRAPTEQGQKPRHVIESETLIKQPKILQFSYTFLQDNFLYLLIYKPWEIELYF